MRIFIICTIVLFLWFLSAMYYLRHKHDIRVHTRIGNYFAEAALIPGILFDVVYNWTFGMLMFMDVTSDWTLSERLSRYRNSDKHKATWRMRWADWICEHILNPYDPKGKHC